MSRPSVAVVRTAAGIDWGAPPYDPPETFPEKRGAVGDNVLYAAVRRAFGALGLDPEGQGTRGWNPLADLVPRGGTVVLQFGAQQAELGERLREAGVRFDARATGLRLSPHIYNSREEIDVVLSCLKMRKAGASMARP